MEVKDISKSEIIVSRLGAWVAVIATILSLLGFAVQSIIYTTRVVDLTFDDMSQKEEIIRHSKTANPLNSTERKMYEEHLKDRSMHPTLEVLQLQFMPKEELNVRLNNIGAALERIEENQKK